MEEYMQYFGQIHTFEEICIFKSMLDKTIIKFDESLLSYLTEEMEYPCTDEQQIINMHLILHTFEKCLGINYSPVEWYNMGEKLVKIIKACFTNILNFVGTPISESYSFDTFVEKCLTIFLSFVNFDNNLKKNLLINVSGLVLSLISNESTNFFVRVTALKKISPLIVNCDVNIKKIILRSSIRIVKAVVMWFLSCGDFETQETLLRFFVRLTNMFKIKVYQLVAWLKDYKELAEAANNLDADNFYPSCRIFLNLVNSTVNPKFKVLTLPCVTVFAENYQLTKPDVLGDKSCSHHSKSAFSNVSSIDRTKESALNETNKKPFSFLDVSLSTIKTNTTIQQTEKQNANLVPDSGVDCTKQDPAIRRSIVASTPLGKRICLAEPKIKLQSELNWPLPGSNPSSSFSAQNKAGFSNKFFCEENIEGSKDVTVLETPKTGGVPRTSIPLHSLEPNSRASLDRFSLTGPLKRDQYMSRRVDQEFQDKMKKYQNNNHSKVSSEEFSRIEKKMEMLHSSGRQVDEDAPLRCNGLQTLKSSSPLQNDLLTEGEAEKQAENDNMNSFNRLDFSMSVIWPDKVNARPAGEEDSFRNLLKKNENGESINEFAKKLVAWGKHSTGRVTLVRPPEDSRGAGIENDCSVLSEVPLLHRLNMETKSENKTTLKTWDRPLSDSKLFSVFKNDTREAKPMRTYSNKQRQSKNLHWQSSDREKSEAKPEQMTPKLDHKVFTEKCLRSLERKRKLYNSKSRCEYEFEESKSDIKMESPVSSGQESKHVNRKFFKGQNRNLKEELDQVKHVLFYELSSGSDSIEAPLFKKANRKIYSRQKKQEAKMRIRRNVTGVVSRRQSLRDKSVKDYKEESSNDSNEEVEQIELKKINLIQKKQKPPVVDTVSSPKEKEAYPKRKTVTHKPKSDTFQSNVPLDPLRCQNENEMTLKEAPLPKVVTEDFMKLKSPPKCEPVVKPSRPLSPPPVTVPEVLSSPPIIDPSPEAVGRFPKAVRLAVSFKDVATSGSLVQNMTVSKTLDTPNNEAKLKSAIKKTEPMEEIYKLGKELKTLERHESPIEMLTKIKQSFQDSLTYQEARAKTLKKECMDLVQRCCDSWKGDIEKCLAAIDSIEDTWYQSIQKSKEKEDIMKANLLKKVQDLLQSLPERKRKEVEANVKPYLELLGLDFPK